ncbi:MAG TPA: RNA methyltransferase [Bacteroidia bacterium]|jgi:tRNA (guanosine-2'-O-)-methyltransferase|nr:RNA methyltransferase [Bacteroidia bacterium]
MPSAKELVNYLSAFITDERKARFEEVLKNRTRHVTIGLEDIFQPHNASAVLRSCDCFGIQDVHIIENQNKYNVNPDVALGSYKWLTLQKHNKQGNNNTVACIQELKAKGYAIAVTSPHKDSYTIDTIPLNKKVALFFGTEMQGMSKELEANAELFVKIPMLGFTESFNISVAAALCMYTLSNRLRKENIKWQLTEEEKEEILLQWHRNTIPKSELLEKDFIQKHQ